MRKTGNTSMKQKQLLEKQTIQPTSSDKDLLPINPFEGSGNGTSSTQEVETEFF